MQTLKHHNREFIRGIGIVDETSCGPLCQHPACWRANERLEKGLPNTSPPKAPEYGQEDDLPVVTVYNMLEDYGESPKDRYPGGQPAQNQTKPQLFPRTLLPLPKHTKTTCPANSPHLSDTPQAMPAPPKKSAVAVKNVEVQEVFDLEDLSNTWEQTFLAKQYYVWVPNPNWKPKFAQASLEAGRSGPKKITPKDMTEELVPRCIEEAREANTTRRHTQSRSRSPFRYFSSSPRQPGLEEVDIEGINELLDLPREVLMKVLDHCQPSDLRSREKILAIVQRFMPDYQTSPNRKPSARNEVLKQTKVQLHDGKLKNVRQPTATVGCQPVFQLEQVLDSEPKQPDSDRNREFSKYRHALPAIGTRTGSLDNFKMSSVSLGLPELPSGVRTTRAFNYTNLDLDFTLGPSVPMTQRSTTTSDGNRSDHGTTINVNVPSNRSETADVLTGRGDSFREAHNSRPESLKALPNLPMAERFICPDPPVGTPMGTPMSLGFQRSLTKSSGFRREVTMDSVEEEGSEARPTPTLEKERMLMNTVRIPTESSASPVSQTGSPGVVHKASPISPRSVKKSSASRHGVLFHKEIPPQPPSSPQSGPAEMSSLSPVPTVTPLATVMEQGQEAGDEAERTPLSKHYGITRELQELATSNRSSPVSSVDAWPTDIVENSFSASRAPTQTSELLPMTPETLNSTAVGFDARSEKSRLTSIPQSEASSRLSDPSLVKTRLARKSSRESPGPPPPSPEPKDIVAFQAVPSARLSAKSRDSLVMAPVFEEGEEFGDDDVSISASPPKNLFDSRHFDDGFSTNREQEDGVGSESPLKRVSAQVDLDMDQEDDQLKDVNPKGQAQDHSNNAKSNQNFSNACVEFFDELPGCPPETDGRSSTYLTERDRRFSPEGLDTPLDIASVQYSEGSVAGGCIMEEDDDDELFGDADVEPDPIEGDDRHGVTTEHPLAGPDMELDPETALTRESTDIGNVAVVDTEVPGIGSSPVCEGAGKNVNGESAVLNDGLLGDVKGEKSNVQSEETMMLSEDVNGQNDAGDATARAGSAETDNLVGNLVVGENASVSGQEPGQESPVQVTDDEKSNNQMSTDEPRTEEEETNEEGQDPSPTPPDATLSGGAEVSVPQTPSVATGGAEVSVPQTPSVTTGGADDSDVGHVTPMYTETSDRPSGPKTVSKPTEGHPSYIN